MRLRVPRPVGSRRGGRPVRRGRRAARRRGEIDEERDGRDVVARDVPRSEPRDAVPLARLRRRVGYGWVTGEGLVDHDVPDADDFVSRRRRRGARLASRRRRLPGLPRPLRALRRRTASRRTGRSPRAWDERRPAAGRRRRASGSAATSPASRRTSTTSSASASSILYLTPFFPAGSTHRYDATSFERVDPLLGGDEALVSLVGAAHARGSASSATSRSITGRRPRVVPRALGDVAAAERGFFWFDERLEHGYAAWAGVRDPAEARPSRRGARPAARGGRRSAGWRRRSISTAGGSTSPTWPAATARSTLRATSPAPSAPRRSRHARCRPHR